MNKSESFEGAEKTVNGAIKIVNLSGTWKEMGRQYGQLMKDELKEVYDFTMNIVNASEENKKTAELIRENETTQSLFTIREFMAGASQTSGLTEEQLQLTNAVEYIAGLPNCSFISACGDYAKDKLTIGRNYDYTDYFKKLKDDVAVTVYHPADGSLATATIGYVGEIYAVNALNEKGIFLELNNGLPSTQSVPKEPVITGTSLLLDWMFEADNFALLDRFFNTSICNLAFIINMADSKKARSYEWCSEGTKIVENTEDGLLVSTNHFTNSDWKFLTPSDENSWNSITRRDNLIALAKKNKGQIDADKMMEIMNVNYEDGGATEDMTVYQLVVQPESLTIWLKIIDASDWTKIDMTKYLK